MVLEMTIEIVLFLTRSCEGLAVAGSSTATSGSGAGVERVFNNTQSLPDYDAGAPLETTLETSVDAFPTPCKKTEVFAKANPGYKCKHRPSNKYLCNVG
jgi:hypothetical protein